MTTNDGLHIRTCSLCEAMCGLEITVANDHVESIRPDKADVWSKGFICPKGASLGDLHHDPDRLRTPMIRRGDEWKESSWDEAFAEVERLLHPVIQEHGIDALAAYIGNPTAHNMSLARYAGAFVPLSGITQLYSAGTVDQWPKNVSSALLYGGMWTIPVPDIDRTQHLLMLGANPSASQGSLLAAPDIMGRLGAISSRGGKVVVVDPRRTATADQADEWIPIRPGTDAALLMAMVQVLFAEDRVRPGRLSEFITGIEDLRELAAPFTPDTVASTTGIPADTIRSLARELSDADPAVVYGRIGTCNQEFGTLASWLVDVINILTGNLDRPGGSMFSNPVVPSLACLRPPEFAEGFEFGRFRSRVRGAPEILGQFPVSCMAEEIAVPGAGQIKALITIAGNPAISAPDAGKLETALPELACMISLDNYLNETTRHAHVILPGVSPLEQPHCGDLIWNWATRNAAHYSPAVFPIGDDRPAEWEILLKLAGIVGGQKAAEVDIKVLDNLFFEGLVGALTTEPKCSIYGRDSSQIAAATDGCGPDRMTDFMIRIGPYGDGYGQDADGLNLDKLKTQTHGIDYGPLEPRLPDLLQTPSGKIEVTPKHITADLNRLQQRLERKNSGLLLVSRRHLRSNNSWMHNVERLVRGRDRCTLLIHPDDAASAGLADGALAMVRSEAGQLRVPVEVSDEMMQGVVSLPHGWGHDREGTKMSVAARHAGVNNNLLAPGAMVDVPSGNAIVNGIPVEVSAAA